MSSPTHKFHTNKRKINIALAYQSWYGTTHQCWSTSKDDPKYHKYVAFSLCCINSGFIARGTNCDHITMYYMETTRPYIFEYLWLALLGKTPTVPVLLQVTSTGFPKQFLPSVSISPLLLFSTVAREASLHIRLHKHSQVPMHKCN